MSKQTLHLFSLLNTYEDNKMNALNTNRRTDFIIGASQLSFAVLIGILALGVSVTALMHAVDPEHFGLWVSQTMFVFGGLEDPTLAREVLGDKI